MIARKELSNQAQKHSIDSIRPPLFLGCCCPRTSSLAPAASRPLHALRVSLAVPQGAAAHAIWRARLGTEREACVYRPGVRRAHSDWRSWAAACVAGPTTRWLPRRRPCARARLEVNRQRRRWRDGDGPAGAGGAHTAEGHAACCRHKREKQAGVWDGEAPAEAAARRARGGWVRRTSMRLPRRARPRAAGGPQRRSVPICRKPKSGHRASRAPDAGADAPPATPRRLQDG
jgi:hypothetical protein